MDRSQQTQAWGRRSERIGIYAESRPVREASKGETGSERQALAVVGISILFFFYCPSQLSTPGIAADLAF